MQVKIKVVYFSLIIQNGIASSQDVQDYQILQPLHYYMLQSRIITNGT